MSQTNNYGVSSSYGVEDIDLTVVEATIQSVAQPLADIINSSLSSGIVAADIKIDKIITLYKSVENLR